MLTLRRLKKLLYYHPNSGDFIWLVNRGKAKMGSQAGYQKAPGYMAIKIDGKKIFSHRLAWFYAHGKWPLNQIDHKNTIKHHNWIANLRPATQAQNIANSPIRTDNKANAKGIHWCLKAKKWIVQVKGTNKAKRYLGSFKTLKQAKKVRAMAAIKCHGEFARG